MHTDPTHGDGHHHKNRHLAERVEKMMGAVMVIAVIVLAIALVWGLMAGGGGTPKYLQ